MKSIFRFTSGAIALVLLAACATSTPAPTLPSPVVQTVVVTQIPNATVTPALSPTNEPLPTNGVSNATAPVIAYVPGSTVKLEQLLGEEDKQLHQPTLSQTVTRYGIEGTDLGYSFEHEGRAYFLFSDTVGMLDKALDTIATTDATNPEQGVRLDFLTVGKDYLTVQPPGISMGGFETPIGGISMGVQMYVPSERTIRRIGLLIVPCSPSSHPQIHSNRFGRSRKLQLDDSLRCHFIQKRGR